jgi:hypothetical protein
LLSALSALYQMTYAGFFVHLNSIPPVLRWLQWLCPLKYALEALAVNEVGAGLMIQDVLSGVPVDVSASLIMGLVSTALCAYESEADETIAVWVQPGQLLPGRAGTRRLYRSLWGCRRGRGMVEGARASVRLLVRSWFVRYSTLHYTYEIPYRYYYLPVSMLIRVKEL